MSHQQPGGTRLSARPGETKSQRRLSTPEGAEVYARLQAFISTCRKQQRNVFHPCASSLLTNPSPFLLVGR